MRNTRIVSRGKQRPAVIGPLFRGVKKSSAGKDWPAILSLDSPSFWDFLSFYIFSLSSLRHYFLCFPYLILSTMASQQNGASNGAASNTFTVKAGLAQMLKGGVIMDVVNAEQVKLSHSLLSMA